jgi:uncharacterized membrane protein YgcG
VKKISLTIVALVMALTGVSSASAAFAAPTEAGAGVADSNASRSLSEAVMDKADILTPAQEQQVFRSIEKNYSQHDVVYTVETVTSLDGKPIAEYALDRARDLKVGNADKDNGVLVLFAANEREVRFELGSGVSDKVGDATVNQIVDSEVIPEFKQENYAEGFTAGMDRIGETYSAEPQNAPDNTVDGVAGFIIVVVAIVGTVIVILLFFGVREIIKAARKSRVRKAKEEKSRFLYSVTRALHEALEDNTLKKQYFNAPNGKARTSVLAKALAPVVAAYPKFSAADGEAEFTRKYVLSSVSRSVFSYVQESDLPTISLNRVKRDYDVLFAAAEKRKEVAVKQMRAENERQAKEAKKAWRSLTRKQRKEIRNTSSNKEKAKLMRSYVPDNGSIDMGTAIPLAVSMYAVYTATSSGSSWVGGHSGGSNSSSSSGSSLFSGSSGSSYTSYSSDSSSYSGGSFDGGGGGGSW